MIGFMQGRLSPPVDGRIQAFPAARWRAEFPLAARHGFALMEWTIDQDGFDENPLLTRIGRAEIAALCRRHGVTIRSLTADAVMQVPFFKAEGCAATDLLDAVRRMIDAAAVLGVRHIVIPLVDNGRIESARDAARLRDGLDRAVRPLGAGGPRIIFESDLGPAVLARFIAAYPPARFGINYDIGNSASLGHDPHAEIAAYAARIDNVHVKDRLRAGGTVPLGQGAADLPAVFRLLAQAGYRGDFILQTARAEDGDDAGALCRYRDRVRAWLDAAA
jgi:L-ribulose-5-phosphate 3-epimerase